MTKKALYFTLGTALFLCTVLTVSAQNKGSATMLLEGGRTGKVSFPHQQHQQVFEADCEVCHKLFPQKKGIIEKLKKEKKIKKQLVMNNCKSCHEQMIDQGKPSGPVKCKECHSG